MAWIAASNEPWITITSGGTGSGPGTVRISVQQNTGAARTGTVTIAGQTFTIQQGAGSGEALSLAGSLAHIASGGGWLTSLTLVNTGTASGAAKLNYFGNDGLFPWLATSEPALSVGASVTLDSVGPASATVATGSSRVLTRGSVNGFAIFKYEPTGQEAVVPLEARNASSYVLAFDQTNGIGTGLALANVSSYLGSVKVVARDDAGNSNPHGCYFHSAECRRPYVVHAR